MKHAQSSPSGSVAKVSMKSAGPALNATSTRDNSLTNSTAESAANPRPPAVAAVPLEKIPIKGFSTIDGLQIFTAGPSTSRQIALTFDDGPHPVFTLKILDELRLRNVKATFFVLGERVKQYPWILRQIVAEGHEIGNHTYNHRLLSVMSNELIGKEILETQEAIKKAVGYETRLFRPPYGAYRPDSNSLFHSLGLSVILWSVDTRDWSVRNHERIYNSVTNRTQNGSVILCHDIHKSTLQALPSILDTLLAQGYQFTTVNQLCGLPSMRIATASAEPTSHPIANTP